MSLSITKELESSLRLAFAEAKARRHEHVTLEHLLYALHVTARVGIWFALAGFFVGYALVDDPQQLGWFALVVIGLAGVQLLSAFYLSRTPRSTPGGGSP